MKKEGFIERLFSYLFTCFMVAAIKLFFEKIQEEKEFYKRYRTVVKENCLGFKSYEYHERE